MTIVTRNAGRAAGDDGLARDEADRAEATIAAWPGYAPTPLLPQPGLARDLGVAAVAVKHEGHRFEVGSFKALGPPYALARALARRAALGDTARCTAVAATSGNHGRALAWGARRLGARARIYMPAHTSAGRSDAIRALGAEIVRLPGSFDDALAAAAAAAHAPGHLLIADMIIDGCDRVARDTLAGYSLLGAELAASPEARAASHVFVAAGNGTLAAATAARLRHRLGAAAPRVVSVEPLASDCVRRSFAAGAPIALADPGRSVMDGLVVGTPSSIAWPILHATIDAAMAIEDAAAIATLRQLGRGRYGDARLEIGETGIAALAGLVVAAREPARTALAISPASRLVAIACEGVTDRAVYETLIADG